MDKPHPTIAVPLPLPGSTKHEHAGSPPRALVALALGRASAKGATPKTRPGFPLHSKREATA